MVIWSVSVDNNLYFQEAQIRLWYNF
jgi:hypothetical protein